MIFSGTSSEEGSAIAVLFDWNNKEHSRISLEKAFNFPLHITDDECLFWLTGWSQKTRQHCEAYYKQCRGPKTQDTGIGKIKIN